MNFEGFLKKVLITLNKAKVKYAIVGGIAAIYYGRPRTTIDLDLIVLLEEEEIDNFCECLKKENFEVEKKEIVHAFREKSHVSIFIKNYPYRIDLKGVYSKIDEASLKNRKKMKILGRNTFIESPEDLIVAKLAYGASQDIDDVMAILLRQRKLDMKYLKKRAKEENVLGKLNDLVKKCRSEICEK